ncbi:MAG: hypothetical protein CM15mV25_1890 [uncultured marine virus]|nr:MAG: hypothetical protein CM15mV25_1890 [uncultured marine virus]
MNVYSYSKCRRVQAFCSAIEMPDREVITKEVRHGNTPLDTLHTILNQQK